MKCTNCHELLSEELVCAHCNHTINLDKALLLEKLAFLIERTANWPVPEEYRNVYKEYLRNLQLSQPVTRETPQVEKPAVQPEPAIESAVSQQIESAATEAEQAKGVLVQLESAEPATIASEPVKPVIRPRTEKVPFEQWLLSERNVKMVLYSGALLLVLAGLIFVGANWARISGVGKFAVTLLITGLMYMGGYVLMRKPALRLGGVALLGVASGFLPLTLVVLQNYVFGPQGFDRNYTIILGSAVCLLVYMMTARWTRTWFFTLFAVAALFLGVYGFIALLPDNTQRWWPLIYMVLASMLLALARFWRPQKYLYRPLVISSHVVAPLLLITAVGTGVGEWMFDEPGFGQWLSVAVSSLGILFYCATDIGWGWRWGRWAAAGAGFFTYTASLLAIGISSKDLVTSWMVLVLVYLAIGYTLHHRSEKLVNGLAFYLGATGLAALVTALTGLMVLFDQFSSESLVDLALALLVDTVLLSLVTAVSRKWYWLYGVTWLFILPAGLFLDISGLNVEMIGLGLGLLGVVYTAVGYFIGQRTLLWGGAFLSGAVILSVIAIPLAWQNTALVSLLLIVAGVLYVLVGIWLRRPFLFFPAWLALDLLLFALSPEYQPMRWQIGSALDMVMFVSGLILITGGSFLRRSGLRVWAWPLYLGGAANAGLAYLVGLALYVHLYTIPLSVIFTLFLLVIAWWELRLPQLFDQKFTPMQVAKGISYLALGNSFVVLFLVFESVLGWEQQLYWWPLATLYCAAILLLPRLIRRPPFVELYGIPARQTALLVMILWLLLSFTSLDSAIVSLTFLIGGLAYGAHWGLQRNRYGLYLAIGLLNVAYWSLLVELGVSEMQLFVLPPGLLLLVGGWIEMRADMKETYLLATICGLGLLMGTSLVQSMVYAQWYYPMLLLVESVITTVGGVLTHSKMYVRLGILALVVNSIVQLGPAFLRLPSWVHLALAGSILLGGGLLALFRRDAIIALRTNAQDTWEDWNP